MRLRELSEVIRELLEPRGESLMTGEISHALVQEIADPQLIYRPVAPAGRKESLFPWLAFSFEPFPGLLEPFKVHTGRMWALVRMHRQPSGLPELLVHINRELPGASAPIAADLYCSFSHSPRVLTIVKQIEKDPIRLRLFHRSSLMEADRSVLPGEFCLPGFTDALPSADPDDGIPGLYELDGDPVIYLGDLLFYNQGRTADRQHLRTTLLNCVAVGVVARYVRDMVRKNLAD